MRSKLTRAWLACALSALGVAVADPKVGLAITIDIGQRGDIHPADKQDVGDRLARLARALAYGETLVSTGPSPLSAVRAGDKIAVSFTSVGQGLTVYGAARPIGFETCDAASHCQFADARVEGDKVLIDAAASGIVKIRYAWSDSPVVNLYNSEGLPATPFELEVH